MATPNDSNPPEGKKIDGEKLPEERISLTFKTIFRVLWPLIGVVAIVVAVYYREHTEIAVLRTKIEDMDKDLEKAIETRRSSTRADYRVLIESKDYTCDDVYWDVVHFKQVISKKNCKLDF